MVNIFKVFSYLLKLLNHPYMDRDELNKYRNKKLKQVIKHAYENVPFYNRKFKEYKLKPNQIKTLQDLEKLPILKKVEIKQNLWQMIAKNCKINNLNKHWTSGSTGEPLIFYINPDEEAFRKAKHLRGNITVGQRPRQRWITITPPFRFATATKLQRIMGIYAPIPISVFLKPTAQIPIIARVNPHVLDGYSSSLWLLAKEIEKRDVETIKPNFIFGGAELTDVISRRYISDVFKAPFYDRYASVELERMAWQCQAKRYHIDADTIVMEFLDENGDSVSPGERGEVVCTSLFNYAMPFLRYAIGDLGVPSDESCPCNRTFPVMKVVEGRKDSLIILPDGRLLSPRTFTIAMRMFKYYGQIDQFRVFHKTTQMFEILVKKKDIKIKEELIETELVNHLISTLDLSSLDVKFIVKFVDDIPLDKSGKLRAVISDR